MPRPSIDYLNARQALMPAGGGRNYRRTETAKTTPASAMSEFDLIRERLAVFFADQRKIVAEFRNSLAAGMTADTEIPF